MSDVFWKQLQQITGSGRCFRQENMSGHTTFRVGGPAEYYVCPERAQIGEIISLCHAQDIPWIVVGNGSNLLVGDKGIPGMVIELGKGFSQVSEIGRASCRERVCMFV